ncbi:WhiB family transcriptional regulator [Streptomyces spinosisporus]|uniref:WhiB family transcriptional regulator n=1 Tax=Streptomyces spinosisporus TaxID=2927582 RepID=A0ABS9XF54_9ACTN|nr:WhiB family transcriptional regulator [Streptomyces spinosisporus]MCI3240247.1 WhiB family transcriptional regulator [Streptomyces spinosisporus]
MDREWESKAACLGQDPEIWFSQTTWTKARRICRDECPVREECLEAILARESGTPDSLRAGIFAGLTGAQRAKVARRRAPQPTKARTKPAGSGRQLAACGTKAAYDRHVRKKEPIDDACRAANAASGVAYRATGSTKVPASR